MKKILLTTLSLAFLVTACDTKSVGNVDPSASPSSSASPSASPSGDPSAAPSADPSATPSSNPNTAACSNETFSVGQEITTEQFFSLICVKEVNVGTKWVYTAAGFDVSVEVTEKNADGTYTIKTTAAGKETISKSQNAGGSVETDPTIKVTYQGMESVTVPAGTYNAIKGTLTKNENGAEANYTYWLDKETGAVKVLSKISAAGFETSVETVLKEFVK